MARYLTTPTQLGDLFQAMMAASDNAHAAEQLEHEKLHAPGVEHDEDAGPAMFKPDACYVCALANDFSGGEEDINTSETGQALSEVIKTVMTNVAGPLGMPLALKIAPALALLISMGYLAGRDAEAAGLPDPRKVVVAEEFPVIEAGAASENTAA